MSCQILLEDTAGAVTVYLESNVDGTAVTGLTFSDLTAALRKTSGSFVAFTLTALNFTELGAGFYEIDLADTDTDTLGNLYLRVQGADVRTALVVAYVAESAPVNPTTPISIPTTELFGYVNNADGSPMVGVRIAARILAPPSVLLPGSEAVVLGTGLVTSETDSGGFFTISLVTGAVVDFFISSANYRRTLTVPGTSQNVFAIA